MFLALWLTVFIVLTATFGYFQGDEVSTVSVSSTDASNSLRIKANRRHHYIFDGKINGKAVRFMVDTGASSVAVPSNLARQLALTKLYPVNVNTANGRTKGHLSRLKSIELGNIRLSNVGAVIMPRSEEPPVVLLGMSALKRLEIKQDKGYLIMIQRQAQ